MNTYLIQESVSAPSLSKDKSIQDSLSTQDHSKETPYGKIIHDVLETVPDILDMGEKCMVVVCPSHGVHDYTWNGLKRLFGELPNMFLSEDKKILYNITESLSHIYFHKCSEPLFTEQKILFIGASLDIRELYRKHVEDFLHIANMSIVMMDFPQMTPLHTTTTPTQCFFRRHKKKSSTVVYHLNILHEPQTHTTKEHQQEDITQCVVCLSNTRTHMCMPCKHLCMCKECIEQVEQCPICRTNIQSTMVVYL